MVECWVPSVWRMQFSSIQALLPMRAMLFQNRSEMTGLQQGLEAWRAQRSHALMRPYTQQKKLPTWGDTRMSGTSLSPHHAMLTGPVPVQEIAEGPKPRSRLHVPASADATNEALRGERLCPPPTPILHTGAQRIRQKS